MQDFTGKVAVITGAARGIGRGLAETAAQEGMQLVLADVDPVALHTTADYLTAHGAEVHPVVTDVTQFHQNEALAAAAYETYGAVHLLCLNAGVAALADFHEPVWAVPGADWERLFAINVHGIGHGLRAFVPRLLAQAEPAYIVTTASEAGIDIGTRSAVYRASKYAAISLMESLYLTLEQQNALDQIGVSVLCPGPVDTNITQATFTQYAAETGSAPEPAAAASVAHIADILRAGLAPNEVAAQTFAAIRTRQFMIITHPSVKERLEARTANIVNNRPPGNPW